MYVQLEAVGPEREAAIERRQRVFGSKPGTAAMGKDEWPITRNRRMHQKDRIQNTEDRIQKSDCSQSAVLSSHLAHPPHLPILPIGLILPIRPY
jgi:hypothetical protein